MIEHDTVHNFTDMEAHYQGALELLSICFYLCLKLGSCAVLVKCK